MNTSLLMGEIAVSTGTSAIITTALDVNPLLTALITFGVSVVTMVGGELIKYLVAFFKKKTKELNEEDEDKKE